jgi:hypothetical protein
VYSHRFGQPDAILFTTVVHCSQTTHSDLIRTFPYGTLYQIHSICNVIFCFGKMTFFTVTRTVAKLKASVFEPEPTIIEIIDGRPQALAVKLGPPIW